MGYESWQAFYEGEFQSLWALLVAPALFLVYLFVRGVDRDPDGGPPLVRFVRIYAAVFALETLLDPIATGPGPRLLELGPGAASGLALAFVLLGDFRVLLLVFHVAREEWSLLRAAGAALLLSALVPVAALLSFRGLETAVEVVPDRVLWLLHELVFAALALYLSGRFVRRHARSSARRHYLRSVCGYVVGYYALWAFSDALILAGVDAGFALRALANQLYYAFYVPFIYLAFPSALRSAMAPK